MDFVVFGLKVAFVLVMLAANIYGVILRLRRGRAPSWRGPTPLPRPPAPRGPPPIPTGGWREHVHGAWLTCTADGAILELTDLLGETTDIPGGFSDARGQEDYLVLTYGEGAEEVTLNVGYRADDVARVLRTRCSLPRQVAVEKVSVPELEAHPHARNGRLVRVRGSVNVAGELRTFAGLWLADPLALLPGDLSGYFEFVGLVRHSEDRRQFGPSGFYMGELVLLSARLLPDE